MEGFNDELNYRDYDRPFEDSNLTFIIRPLRGLDAIVASPFFLDSGRPTVRYYKCSKPKILLPTP